LTKLTRSDAIGVQGLAAATMNVSKTLNALLVEMDGFESTKA